MAFVLYFSMGIRHFMNQHGKDLVELLIYSAVISQITTYEIVEGFRHYIFVVKMATTNHAEYYSEQDANLT